MSDKSEDLHYWWKRALDAECREERLIDALIEIVHAGSPEEEKTAIRDADKLFSERIEDNE